MIIRHPTRHKEGYIAIMSALIITAVITIILVSLGQASFLQRINTSDTHLKEKSRALAQACVNAALLKLASSSSYAGNETIAVAGDTCKIISVISSSTGNIISTQGQYQSSYTDLQVTVTTGTISLVGSQEVQNF